VRVVLDTNVLLAGVATHGLCEALMEIVLRDHTLISSEYILQEFERHYGGKFKASAKQTAEAIKTIRTLAEVVEPVAVPSDACPDEDDLLVIGTAMSSDAEYLVTGDRQLLDIGNYDKIRIVSPRQFYDLFRDKMG
jgi:putative PIN family toxin of toxin-antitoxin system